MAQAKREYGIDLLKMVSMVLIVLDHILYWGGGGFCSEMSGLKGFVLGSIDAICLLHVNCFVLASGWIMSRLEFKFRRLVKLWLEVVGYSFVFVAIAIFCCPSFHFGIKDIAKCLLPISTNQYWFFTQYVALFFAMPALNATIKHLNKRTLVIILFGGFLCFSVHPFMFQTDIFHLNRGYSALWFMYLYLLAGTMSVHRLFEDVSSLKSLTVGVIGICAGITAFYLRDVLSLNIGRTFNAELFRSYNCPFIFLYSVAIFLSFSKIGGISTRYHTMISAIAPSVFSVYIIHSNRLFRAMTDWNIRWSGYLDAHSILSSISVAIASAIIIFCGCITVDVARKRILAKLTTALMARIEK